MKNSPVRNILKLKKNFIEKCKGIDSLNKKLLKSEVKGKRLLLEN